MTDEYNRCPLKEFFGLQPKIYSIIDANNTEKKTSIGISMRATTTSLRHQTYYNALYNETSTTVTMQKIRSIGHTSYSMSLTKTDLSPCDDNRYVLTDKISILAFGHCKIRNSNESGEGGGGAACAPPLPPIPIIERANNICWQ